MPSVLEAKCRLSSFQTPTIPSANRDLDLCQTPTISSANRDLDLYLTKKLSEEGPRPHCPATGLISRAFVAGCRLLQCRLLASSTQSTSN